MESERKGEREEEKEGESGGRETGIFGILGFTLRNDSASFLPILYWPKLNHKVTTSLQRRLANILMCAPKQSIELVSIQPVPSGHQYPFHYSFQIEHIQPFQNLSASNSIIIQVLWDLTSYWFAFWSGGL